MAVFTYVTPEQAADFIKPLKIGEMISLRGILSGIENSNYFLTTDKGDFVLTLFERLTSSQLPFYLQLMLHFAAKGIPVPEPKRDSSGQLLFELNGKPTSVVSKLDGLHCLEPRESHRAQVGEMLARMHLAGRDFELTQENPRGFDWWFEAADKVAPFLDDERRKTLLDELQFQKVVTARESYGMLPRGPIHADLFRDNVLFTNSGSSGNTSDDDKLSGFFDFYFAGTDILLFDVAVCLNDWCIDRKEGTLDQLAASSFLAAYERTRPVTSVERQFLPAMLRAAALRFWLSRLFDVHFSRASTLLQAHDPEHFYRVLSCHRRAPLY